MSLSNDLISEFAKMTNNKNEQTEATVYGTTVSHGGKIYVIIDGSDVLTPVATTSEIKAGERVTVMIKDHTATITGNITNPSASTGTVSKILDDYDVIVAKIGDFELVIADKVTTEELEAEVARIDEALIGKATIEQLEAVDAKIENLDVTELEAEVARIDEALIGKAEITDLEAIYGDISVLESDVANISSLVGGNLTMDNIQSLILTSSKVTVDNAFIKDAMIDRVSASKLNAGVINTNLVSIQSEDGSMNISGTLQQFKDNEGNVRIQIGKDASGDFTFILYGEDGTGQLINQNGITASAIGDGLIVNDMVADNANISGSKLDISTVVEEINDGTKSIKGTKIFLDDANQTLDVAFNTLSTTVTDTKSKTESNTTSITAMQGQINTAISNTQIVKDGQTILLKDDYSNTVQTVDSIEQTIGTHTSQIDGINKTVSTQGSDISQLKNQISLKVEESDITTAIDNLDIGGRNLLLKSGVTISNNEYNINSYTPTELFTSGETYTLTICITPAEGVNQICAFISDGYALLVRFYDIDKIVDKNKAIISETFTFGGYYDGRVPTKTTDNNALVRIYRIPNDGTVTTNTTIHWVKLEKGNKATDWTPAPEDNSQIGTRNYFLNGNFAETSTSTTWTTSKHDPIYPNDWSCYNPGIENPTTSYHAHVDQDTFGYNVIEFNESDGSRNWKSVNQNVQSRFVKDVNYRLSLDIYPTGDAIYIFGGFYYFKIDGTTQSFHGGQYKFDNSNWKLNEWQRVSIEVPYPVDVDLSRNVIFYIYAYGFGTNSILYIRNVSLTNSDFTSAYLPSPEDTTKEIDTKISSAKAEIKVTTDSITQSVEKVETTVKDISIGSTNLLRYSKMDVNDTSWGWFTFLGDTGAGPFGTTYKHYTNTSTATYVDILRQLIYVPNDTKRYLKPNTWYTLSFYAKGSSKIRSHIYPSLINTNIKGYCDGVETTLVTDGNKDWALTDTWTKHTYTFKTPSTLSSTTNGEVLFRTHNGDDVYICAPKLEEGNKATDWTPAPEDVDTSINSVKSTLTTRADSIEAKVTQNGQDIATLKLSVDGIDLTGFVSFSDLSGSGTTTINGNNITTGYVSGDRIKGGTLTAVDEINFVDGCRIFGSAGPYGYGLEVSASTIDFTGCSDGYMQGSWVVGDSLTVGGDIKGTGNIQLYNNSLYAPVGTAYRDYIKFGSTLLQADTSYGLLVTNTSGAWQTVRCGTVVANGTTLSSDKRFKTDIRYVDVDAQTIGETELLAPNTNISYEDMHEFIETLPMASYRLIEEYDNGMDKSYYGFIAQDILYTKVGSELIEYDAFEVEPPVFDEEGNVIQEAVLEERLRYSENKFIAFICGALKQEIKKRKELETRLINLENLLNN